MTKLGPYYHFSPRRIFSTRTLEWDQEYGMKPFGFWVSDERSEHSWSKLCEDRDIAVASFVYEVHIMWPTNMLVIGGLDDFTKFERYYCHGVVPGLGVFSSVYQEPLFDSVRISAGDRHITTSRVVSNLAIKSANPSGKYYIEDMIHKAFVDWNSVSMDYDGIIIMPYVDPGSVGMWYAPWECASACIWRTRNVSIKMIAGPTKKTNRNLPVSRYRIPPTSNW